MFAKILVGVTAAALLGTGGYLYFHSQSEQSNCSGPTCPNVSPCSAQDNSCSIPNGEGAGCCEISVKRGCCSAVEQAVQPTDDLPLPREVK